MKRNRCIALLFVVVLALLLAASSILQKRAAVEAAGVQAPRFEVDPAADRGARTGSVDAGTVAHLARGADRLRAAPRCHARALLPRSVATAPASR